jgi:carnitine O-acetyltransferase
LQFRESVVINVSYFFQFQDDPTASTTTNIDRAATLLFAAAEFRHQVATGQLPADQIGKKKQPTPLCSTPYKYMFHASRIPQPKQDTYRIYDPSRYHHAIVARQGHFFSISLSDPTTGTPLPVQTIQSQLQRCVELANAKPTRGQLGILTSSHRDTWTQARETLLQHGGAAMKDALEQMESGALLLNLDDTTPVSREECCQTLLMGGSDDCGSNRWFDKSIQLLVTENGKSGILGEHSMMDGMVLVNVSNHMTNTTYQDAQERSKALLSVKDETIPPVQDIFQEALEQIDDSVLNPLLDQGT